MKHFNFRQFIIELKPIEEKISILRINRLVLIFALLILSGKLSHINTRTSIFSLLIFINMCVLNSYRYIEDRKSVV